MEASEIPVLNPVVVLREEADDWAILFNPDTSQAVGINPVGVRIWKLTDGKTSVHDIGRKVREHFSNVPEAADREVNAFLDELADKGFIGREAEA